MSNKRTGVLVFFAGLAVMALSAIMGKVLQARLFELGMAEFQHEYGMTGMVLAMVFFSLSADQPPKQRSQTQWVGAVGG